MPLTIFIKISILDVALKSDYSICILITTLRFLGKIEIGIWIAFQRIEFPCWYQKL